MASNIREIKRRIVSVGKTRNITSAMKMVAAAKFRKAQKSLMSLRPYAIELEGMMKSILQVSLQDHNLMREQDGDTVGFCVVTSDRGLCGGFNSNIVRHTVSMIEKEKKAGNKVKLYVIGNKGYQFFSKRNTEEIVDKKVGFYEKIHFEMTKSIVDDLLDFYSRDNLKGLYLVYNEFKNVMEQRLTAKKLLPIQFEFEQVESDEEYFQDYIYEPSPKIVIDSLLYKYINYIVYRSLSESSASEQGSRMTSMDSATENASTLITELTLVYNKVRQELITRELSEIVGGAEALK